MYGNLPKSVLAEILLFLSEREHFESLQEFGAVSQRQLVVALQELAHEMLRAAENEDSELQDVVKNLRKPHQKLVEKLSTEELDRLLRGFVN